MITANELKTKGVKALEEQFEKNDEIGITVRGKMKYVVVKAEDYDDYHHHKIKKAYEQVKTDIAAGDHTIETATEHINRLWPK